MRRLDKVVARRIRQYLIDRVAVADDPRTLGMALQGSEHSGHWRYRVGDYRLVCEIEHNRLVVLVVEVGHRREIYR